MIILDKKAWGQLQKTQHDVNDQIKYRKDIDKYGKSDYWTVPEEIKGKFEGDCEDYACAKQATLKEIGIPSWLATCWTELDQYHAVLIVETTTGSLVLDNRYIDVRRYEDLKYRWHKKEGEDEKWYEIV